LDFRKFFRENYNGVYSYAFRMSSSRETAEDISQEAFLRMAKKAEMFQNEEEARRWTFTVARNLCLDFLRKRKERNQVPLEKIPEPESSEPNPSKSAMDSERNIIIKNAVLDLPPDLREFLILRAYENMSYDEISEITGCPEGTVKSRLARAREILRNTLKPLLEEMK
jgi:RNA polymerase sigma-70 factor (ECF subfamily)